MIRPPMASRHLDDPASYAAPDAECDLIMKGGITSGLVYPLAACRLATRYRFRQLGGSSAGAIAAALTAAAEFQRRPLLSLATAPEGDPSGATTDALAREHPPAGIGFLGLVGIPDEMGEKLSTLFQPAPSLRPAFGILTAAVEPSWSIPKKIFRSLIRVVVGQPLWFGVTTLLVFVLLGLPVWATWPPTVQGWLGLLVALIVAKLLGLIVAAVRFVLVTMSALEGNGFGACIGLSEPDGQGDALTEWLTTKLDEVAGLAPGEGPLTFGHLYGDAASEVFRTLRLDEADAPEDPAERASFAPELDLKMMTTCLTFQRPFTLPFRTKIFHFCPDCWRSYFPEAVIAKLTEVPRPAKPKFQTVDGQEVEIDQHCPHHPQVVVQQLPPAPDLPVVVGVRMSLAFPALISAVPLYTVDFSRKDGRRGLVKVWFSDGGIGSNFPIHFFDALWPRRPTFGITLADQHPDFPDELVWRPSGNAGGLVVRPISVTSVVDFAIAVFETMHNWVDNTAIPGPGYRDRVVELRMRDGEGGLNLKMEKGTITELGDRGDQAAVELEDFDWDNHRWVRYRTSTSGMAEVFHGLTRAAPDYGPFVAARTGGSYPFDPDERLADSEATAELLEVAAEWQAAGYPATAGNLPDPRPSLRLIVPQ